MGVNSKDQEKTAFCSPEALFQFNVMPFGLCNAPVIFQRLMDSILDGLHWRNCFMYDTAQFKLHTCVCITRVYLVALVEHF